MTQVRPSLGDPSVKTSASSGDEVKPQTIEQRIRDRAYQLWQQDGALEGCADEYWYQARQMVEQEISEDEGNSFSPDS
jgi:hypothetical protein